MDMRLWLVCFVFGVFLLWLAEKVLF